MSHQSEPVRAGIRARRIGFLAQSVNLFGHLTVAANVAFVRALAADAARVPRPGLLESVGLAGRASAYPGELSGGESARAGLVVALAHDPAVVLADEPTGELDSATEADVLGLLVDAARGGTAVLVASHSPAVAGGRVPHGCRSSGDLGPATGPGCTAKRHVAAAAGRGGRTAEASPAPTRPRCSIPCGRPGARSWRCRSISGRPTACRRPLARRSRRRVLPWCWACPTATGPRSPVRSARWPGRTAGCCWPSRPPPTWGPRPGT